MNFHLTNGGNCFGICPCVHIRCNVDCSGRPIESFRVGRKFSGKTQRFEPESFDRKFVGNREKNL